MVHPGCRLREARRSGHGVRELCPADLDFFVMEAVSNCTDWINLRRDGGSPADTGGTVLEPAETLTAQTRWVPKPVLR